MDPFNSYPFKSDAFRAVFTGVEEAPVPVPASIVSYPGGGGGGGPSGRSDDDPEWAELGLPPLTEKPVRRRKTSKRGLVVSREVHDHLIGQLQSKIDALESEVAQAGVTEDTESSVDAQLRAVQDMRDHLAASIISMNPPQKPDRSDAIKTLVLAASVFSFSRSVLPPRPPIYREVADLVSLGLFVGGVVKLLK